MRVRYFPRIVAVAAAAGLVVAVAAGQAVPAVAAFDQDRAFADAETMVALGPRPLGSEALEANRRYIDEQLRAVGLEPERDEFTAATPMGDIGMANIIARVTPRDGAPSEPRIVLASHFDTKLFNGVDFVGANDGASSTAVLLEIARALAAHPPGLPVDLVFFDGEEAAVSWSDVDGTYGSRSLAARWQAAGQIESIGAMILLDMVGDASLQIPRETNSTTWINDVVWDAARELGYEGQFPETRHAILDDHLPFIDLGVDAIDLIDFTYGPGNRYWHAPFYTLDKISAESLGVVGRVVLQALPTIELLLGG